MIVRATNHHHLAQQARMEAAALIAAVSCRRVAEPVKTAIQRAAQRLGWSYTRAEDVWRLEARRIDSWEMDMLRAMSFDIKRKSKKTSPEK